MRGSDLLLPLIALTIFGAIGLFVSIRIARKIGRVLNFRTLLIWNYLVSEILSGIVHLTRVEPNSRGYFDVLNASGDSSLTAATVGAVVGLVALLFATSLSLSKSEIAPLSVSPQTNLILARGDIKTLGAMSAILLPAGILATLQVSSYVRSLDATRVIALSDGQARFSYISNWLVWAIAFVVLILLSGNRAKSRIVTLMIVATAVLGIVLSLNWTGGRSIVVVMVLPLLLAISPALERIRWWVVPTAIGAAITYIVAITVNRGFNSVTYQSNLWTFLDWEWGRFSMTGFASKFVDDRGFLWGETFVAGFVNFILGIVRLFGWYIPNPKLTTSTQASGESILNSDQLNYVVPGLSAELYINFGIVGIAVGYFLLGRITRWVDLKFVKAPTMPIRLLYAYVGTLLVFRTIPADSGSIYAYLIYSGIPLITAAVISWVSLSSRPRPDGHVSLRGMSSPRL